MVAALCSVPIKYLAFLLPAILEQVKEWAGICMVAVFAFKADQNWHT